MIRDSGEDGGDEQDAGTQTRNEEDDWALDEDVEGEDVDPNDLAVYKKFLNEGKDFADFAPSMASLTTGEGQPQSDGHEKPAFGENQEGESTNLADLILQRIAEKEAQEVGQRGVALDEPFEPPEGAVEIPARVAETFTKVGQLLTRYKSGPLPKPFKVLPTRATMAGTTRHYSTGELDTRMQSSVPLRSSSRHHKPQDSTSARLYYLTESEMISRRTRS